MTPEQRKKAAVNAARGAGKPRAVIDAIERWDGTGDIIVHPVVGDDSKWCLEVGTEQLGFEPSFDEPPEKFAKALMDAGLGPRTSRNGSLWEEL